MTDEMGRELKSILDEKFRGSFKDSPVAASNLEPLLVHFLKDESLKQKIILLRDVERRVRNLAAHEITSITEERIKDIFGQELTIGQIFKMIKALTVAAKIPIKNEFWDSYGMMNKKIETNL